MRPIGRSAIGLVCARALLPLTAGQAEAWGAIAVGASSDDDTVIASALSKATEAEAGDAALEACRTAKTGSDKAPMACTVVRTTQWKCFAIAGSKWAVTANGTTPAHRSRPNAAAPRAN